MPADFSRYEIEDFAFDESFRQWVLQLDSAHRPFWERYLADHPRQTDNILAARQLVAQLDRTQTPQADELARTIWQNIDQRIAPRGLVGTATLLQTPPRRANPIRRVISLLLLAGGGWLAWYWQANWPGHGVEPISPANVSELTNSLTEHNRSDSTLTIRLGDGSLVGLSPGSRLTYPRVFDSRYRVTYLTGEASFEVTKQSQPFVVHTGELATTVTGAIFRISARANAPVLVDLAAGRATVSTTSDWATRRAATPSGLLLTPNQRAVFLTERAQLSKTLVDVPLVLGLTGQLPSFDFRNVPARAVFAALETAYGINIVYDADLTNHPNLTLNADGGSLYAKLAIVCAAIGASYRLIDGQIVIEPSNPERTSQAPVR